MRQDPPARTVPRTVGWGIRHPAAALAYTMTHSRFPAVATAWLAALAASPARAAGEAVAEWLPAIVLGGIVLFVAGVLVRMFFAARFPRGYRQWAERRRDRFAERNDAWDREDEEFRK